MKEMSAQIQWDPIARARIYHVMDLATQNVPLVQHAMAGNTKRQNSKTLMYTLCNKTL
jgi:hypothetical protein